ncbi:MAG: glycosyltransferase family 4 protein, partial [Alicyclobacillaceae bacterium]|nr:glycosyltransferase family 4 protein [Alicyclobacillaceae bacterium]
LPRPVVGTVARMHAAKGHAVLLEAAGELVKRGFSGSFVWIGDGPLKTELARRVQEAGLEDRIRLVGYQPSVERWLRAVDLVVLPSLSEGFGLALLEALACGKPVVATRVGGLAEVGEGLPGVRLVPPGDPMTLAAAIDEAGRGLLENPRPEEIARRFSLEHMVARTEDVYTQFLAKMSK